jgi:AcrR family transcriptional regulator
VFETKGFLDTRIADIAAAAGISHGTFYTYFQTKEEVFRNLMAEVAEAQYKATEVPEQLPHDPEARIEYSIRHYLQSYREMAAITGVIEQVAILDEDFRKARLEIRREFRARIERGLRRLQASGLANPALPPRATAEAITSMLSNFAYVSCTLGEDYEEDEAVVALTRMWADGIGLVRATLSAPPVAPQGS